ncbi:MAG: hydroxyacid dehydrogenase [Rhodospirillaceae bacterium]|nr:hydroxyacid dehydrogenase [Rhodospirillaceae bacterium]
MADIVITEFMDAGIAERMVREHGALYDPTLVDRPDDMLHEASQAKALIVRNRSRVTAELLDACPNLAVVGRLGVGLERIDLEACAARNVSVFPARGANAVAVAEYAIASVMMLRRRCFQVGDAMLAGEWPREQLNGCEVAGSSLGVLGFGDIGRHVARRATAIGMTVLACDPYVHPDHPSWRELRAERVSFADLMSRSDAITAHVPLTDETRNIIDAAALVQMASHAVVVNSSRGGVVDEAALADALREGRIGGAALDVFTEEPLSAAGAVKFQGVPNLVLTPHIAGVTQEANLWTSVMIVNAILETLGRAPFE